MTQYKAGALAIMLNANDRRSNACDSPPPFYGCARTAWEWSRIVSPVIAPQDCTTMTEVRAGVDAVDAELVALLGRRFRYMDAAARIKPTRDAVRDEARKAQVIANARRAAADAGVPADLVGQLYEQLVEASIAYELVEFDCRSG